MNWHPESEPRWWWALPLASVGIITVYLQYRYVRAFVGGLFFVGGLAIALGLLLWVRPGPAVSQEVEGISAEDIEISLTQPARGAFNDIPYVGISLAWAAPEMPEGVGFALIGTLTRVRGARMDWEQGSPGFDSRDAMAAEAWGLASAKGFQPPLRQSPILRIPSDHLSELIVPGASLETTAWFRVDGFRPPAVFERPATGTVRSGDGFFNLLEWKERTPDGLEIRYLWMGEGNSGLPAVVLVGPDGREWTASRNSSSSGSTVLGRTTKSGMLKWSPRTRSEKIDGKWVQVPAPGEDWFAGSQVWIGMPEQMGVIRKEITIPVELISPEGNWWAVPVAVSPNHRPDRPEVSFVNLRTGETAQAILGDEPRQPEQFEWADEDTLLFESGDGTLRAIDLKRRDGSAGSPFVAGARPATDGERSRAFRPDGKDVGERQ
ncbi:MAG: hypothetical protein ACLFTU_04795 [Puniceicoccaceae bacterium]